MRGWLIVLKADPLQIFLQSTITACLVPSPSFLHAPRYQLCQDNIDHALKQAPHVSHMPFTIVIYSWRKPGLSPAEFKDHYEHGHVPLVQYLTGPLFPLSHTRHYIQRTPGETASTDSTNVAHPANVFVGSPSDFEYDAFAELVFEDVTKFQAFFGCVSTPEAAARIAEDEEKFLDRPKMRVAAVDDTAVTTRSAVSG